jgi:hypothetical protein
MTVASDLTDTTGRVMTSDTFMDGASLVRSFSFWPRSYRDEQHIDVPIAPKWKDQTSILLIAATSDFVTMHMLVDGGLTQDRKPFKQCVWRNFVKKSACECFAILFLNARAGDVNAEAQRIVEHLDQKRALGCSWQRGEINVIRKWDAVLAAAQLLPVILNSDEIVVDFSRQ